MALKLKQIKAKQLKIGLDEAKHTNISYIMNFLAIMIMTYFGLRHLSDDPNWSQSAFMQLGFGAIGLIGIQIASQQPIIPISMKKGKIETQFQPMSLETGIRGLAIALLGMAIQFIAAAVYSFTLLEQAVYFIFSAITEEVFFRGFLLTLFFRMDPDKRKYTPFKMFAIVFQAVAFTAIHQNYYNDLPVLISVFIGGLMLGIVYLIWEDLTANVIGHFLINLVAVQNILVLL